MAGLLPAGTFVYEHVQPLDTIARNLFNLATVGQNGIQICNEFLAETSGSDNEKQIVCIPRIQTYTMIALKRRATDTHHELDCVQKGCASYSTAMFQAHSTAAHHLHRLPRMPTLDELVLKEEGKHRSCSVSQRKRKHERCMLHQEIKGAGHVEVGKVPMQQNRVLFDNSVLQKVDEATIVI